MILVSSSVVDLHISKIYRKCPFQLHWSMRHCLRLPEEYLDSGNIETSKTWAGTVLGVCSQPRCFTPRHFNHPFRCYIIVVRVVLMVTWTAVMAASQASDIAINSTKCDGDFTSAITSTLRAINNVPRMVLGIHMA